MIATTTIEDACALVTDGTHYTPKNAGRGIPFLTVKDVSNEALDFLGCSFISQEDFETARAGNSAPQPGDVLFSKDGTVGKVHVVETDRPFAVLSSLAILRPKMGTVDPKYFGHVLRSPDVLNDAFKRKTGSAIRRVILSDLKNVRIPLPPLPQQRRIAEILDKADALRAKRRAAVAELDSLTQSIFLDMFGQPLSGKSRWRSKPLGEACEKISDGTHHSPPIQSEGIPYVTAKHLKEEGLDFYSDPWFVSEVDHRAIFSRCDPRPGDVLYIKDGATTGIAAVNRYEFEFSMLSSLALLRPKAGVLTAEYLCHWLNNARVKRWILGGMAGAAIRRLTLAKIKAIRIPLPPLQQQEIFALRIARVHQLSDGQRAAVVELDSLFISLQSRAFRGELRTGSNESSGNAHAFGR